jgi:hypothetical protein
MKPRQVIRYLLWGSCWEMAWVGKRKAPLHFWSPFTTMGQEVPAQTVASWPPPQMHYHPDAWLQRHSRFPTVIIITIPGSSLLLLWGLSDNLHKLQKLSGDTLKSVYLRAYTPTCHTQMTSIVAMRLLSLLLLTDQEGAFLVTLQNSSLY